MPAVKTGMTPPPMPGMPAPMQPMGGMPPAQNPFAPMPPMPLAGAPMPQPPMPMPPMPQGQPMGQMPQGQPMQVSTAGRRRRFGDALEGMIGRNQGIGGAMPQQQRPMPMPQMMPQQRMVAPGVPMMKTPPMQSMTARPMAMGGEVDIFGYEDGGPVVQHFAKGGAPNLRELMDATGLSAFDASDLVYGVVGSNTDIRDWDAIMSSDDPLASARAATSQMYSGDIDVSTTTRDSDRISYNPDARDSSAAAAGGGVQTRDFGDGRVGVYDNRGNLIRTETKARMDRGSTYLDPFSGYASDQNFIRSDAADLAREAYERAESRRDLDDYTLALQRSAAVGEQIRQLNEPRGGDPAVRNRFLNDALGDAQELASYGFYVSPQTGELVGQPDVPLVSGLTYYPDNLKAMMSPETYSTYRSRFDTQGASQDYYQSPVQDVAAIDVFDPDGVGPDGVSPDVSGDGILSLNRPATTEGFSTQVFRDGGAVPRQTMIGDQPHMLAYINPQEANLLKDLGGSGEPGPGGIPAYEWSWSESSLNPKNWGGGGSSSSSSNNSSTGSSGYTSLDAIANAAVQADDDKSFSYMGKSYDNVTDYHDAIFGDDDNNSSGTVNTSAKDADLGVGGSSSTVTAADLASGTGTTTYDTGGGGSVTVATGSSIDDVLSTASSGGGGGGGGSSVVNVIAPPSVYTPPAPVYTDRRGKTYGSQAEADAADRAFAAQLALASSSVRDDAGRLGFGVSDNDVDYLAGLRMDDGRVQPGFVPSSMLGGAGPAGLYSGIGGIGSGPASGAGVGVTPAPITSPDISTDVSRPDVGPEAQYEVLVDDLFGTGSDSDILSLQTPSAATMYPYDVPASVLAAQLRGGPLTPGMVSPDAGGVTPAVASLTGAIGGRDFDADMDPTDRDRVTAEQIGGDRYTYYESDIGGDRFYVGPFEDRAVGYKTGDGGSVIMANRPDLSGRMGYDYDAGRYTIDGNILPELGDSDAGAISAALQAGASPNTLLRNLFAQGDVPATDDDMGLPSGPVTDLQRGLGTTGPIAARDADMDPFGTGTQVSLQDVKDRVARAEGTADEGGYGRLLGNQEGRFDVDLTNMTVQEVLDFQKKRGPGSYAEYSQGVNEQRGMTRADGSGVISTPAGKYQVVGATLEDLIDKGVVDPTAKFDEGTQEKIGSYLIAERRGLNDLQAGNITREEFEENLGKEFEGIKRGLDKGAGSTALTIGAASEAGRQAEVGRRDDNVEKIQKQIGDQAEPTGGEKLFYDFVGQLGFGLGKPLADKLRGASREDRQAIIDQHLYALENGATPKTDEEGNYVGFDISTMDTFADKVLAAEDIMAFMPPSHGTYKNPAYQADADGDGVLDSVRFDQVYGAQSTAATEDPYGYSTEQGFITSDGKEYFVDATGNVVEVTDGVVPFEPGGGDDTTDIFTTTTMTDDGGDDDTTTTTTDDTGHKDGVCNNPDYVYNPETDKCEPKKEEETDDGDLGSPITSAITPRSFDEVLRSVVVPAPDIAPISANIRPMQGGGMAGLNRAADNFLKALAG